MYFQEFNDFLSPLKNIILGKKKKKTNDFVPFPKHHFQVIYIAKGILWKLEWQHDLLRRHSGEGGAPAQGFCCCRFVF